MALNQATLIGNLGKDPDLTYTQSGTARCRFSLATTEVWYDNNNEKQEKTEWHNVVVWGKQAESAGKYLEKGRQVCVVGKIEYRSWDDQKTGEKKYITEIKAQRVVFLSGGQKSGGGGNRGGGGRSGGDDGGGDGGGGGRGSGSDRSQDDQGGGGGFDGPGDDSDIPF